MQSKFQNLNAKVIQNVDDRRATSIRKLELLCNPVKYKIEKIRGKLPVMPCQLEQQI